MQLLELTPEQLKVAEDAVMARFMSNSVAYQAIPIEYVNKNETVIRWNRYDYQRQIVVDNETLTLCEPYASTNFTRSQRDEESLTRGLTTIHRQTSELARFFDAMAFVGLDEAVRREIANVEVPNNKQQNFISLSEAAMQVESAEECGPILVEPADSQESVVSAAFEAVFRLEGYGYYSNYLSIWGERIWALLHQPEQHDSVLPREIIQDTIPAFYRSTTLPPDEALVVSLDGPTLKYVVAAANENTGEDGATSQELVCFEPLRIETDDQNEEIYKYRCRFRAVPCVQEVRSVVRIKLADRGYAAKSSSSGSA